MDRLRRIFARWLTEVERRRLRRTARRLAGWRRVVIIPLLEPEHTRHALELACQLASERRPRMLLLAPLFVEWELPLDAHFHDEEAALRAELDRECALAESYGVNARGAVVRARPGELGRGIAKAAEDVDVSFIVIGAAAQSQSGFRRPFSRDVWSVLHDVPCPVMIATRAAVRAKVAAA